MSKVLFITPHLSTGGMPQYLLEMITSSIEDGMEVSVIEHINFSDDFVVQKNKIKKLCKIYTLNGNDKTLIPFINNIQPDIIHFQEVPQSFLSDDVISDIFSDKRSYKIVVTTHGSDTKPEEQRFVPDRWILVSKWSYNRFAAVYPKDTCGVWEYPVRERKSPTTAAKAQAKHSLNWSSNKFNIINVGLFTPGKNQAELFNLARHYKNIDFHFIGNYAMNFSAYWKPLFETRTSNIFIYGERPDVETFYLAADMFYFASTLELNPLVVKEALSYHVPIVMRKLPTYLNQYDNSKLVTYIDEKKVRNNTILDSFIKHKTNRS